MNICVSSSCRFEKDWQNIVERFPEHRIVTPDVRDLTGLGEEEIKTLLNKINIDFYREIDDCDLLYVWCPEGYIGKGVAAEIGYALAKGKRVVSSAEIEDAGIRSLVRSAGNLTVGN